MAIEEITVLVKYPTGGQEEQADVPLDFNLGEFRKQSQENFAIPKTRNCTLALEKTGEILSDNDTFKSAGILNNAVLLLVPTLEGA
jgi:hypothetical protein